MKKPSWQQEQLEQRSGCRKTPDVTANGGHSDSLKRGVCVRVKRRQQQKTRLETIPTREGLWKTPEVLKTSKEDQKAFKPQSQLLGGCRVCALGRGLSGGRHTVDPESRDWSGRCGLSGCSAMTLFSPSASASSTSISKAEEGPLSRLGPSSNRQGRAGASRGEDVSDALRDRSIPAPPNPTEGLRSSLGSLSFLAYKMGMLMGSPLWSTATNPSCRKKSQTGRLQLDRRSP